MNARRRLPEHLRDAYAWTNAAGELPDLLEAAGAELDRYVADSVANARDCGDRSVTADDLHALRDWLLDEAADG